MKKQAFNPYLPSWEYIPDGEPYVFGDRVDVYKRQAVPSDIKNSAVNIFRWNQQISETSVIERVWGDSHQDKSHR